MAKANQTPKADKATPATAFPSNEEMQATAKAILNPPSPEVARINWASFENEMGSAWDAMKAKQESLSSLANKMYIAGVRYSHFCKTNDAGKTVADFTSPVAVETRSRFAKLRLTPLQQTWAKLSALEVATLTSDEKHARRLVMDDLVEMMRSVRRALKEFEEKETRGSVTIEESLYALTTEIFDRIRKCDEDKVKFDVMNALDTCRALRRHFSAADGYQD
jgi:hypothetical protein